LASRLSDFDPLDVGDRQELCGHREAGEVARERHRAEALLLAHPVEGAQRRLVAPPVRRRTRAHVATGVDEPLTGCGVRRRVGQRVRRPRDRDNRHQDPGEGERGQSNDRRDDGTPQQHDHVTAYDATSPASQAGSRASM
jgi:hypothetical protein